MSSRTGINLTPPSTEVVETILGLSPPRLLEEIMMSGLLPPVFHFMFHLYPEQSPVLVIDTVPKLGNDSRRRLSSDEEIFAGISR